MVKLSRNEIKFGKQKIFQTFFKKICVLNVTSFLQSFKQILITFTQYEVLPNTLQSSPASIRRPAKTCCIALLSMVCHS